MRIDIFSDVICPWCFIGKRRLETALRQRPLGNVELHWRAFQLNPDMPVQGMPRQLYLETKFGGTDRARQVYETIRQNGAAEGIDFQFDKIARTPNTVLAHRLIRFASDQGFGDPLVERLFVAYFTEGVDIGDRDKLIEQAIAVGMDAEEVSDFLAGSGGQPEVQAETRFAYENGINGVPCFIFNRHYALAGAQDPSAFFPLFELSLSEETEGSPPKSSPTAANSA